MFDETKTKVVRLVGRQSEVACIDQAVDDAMGGRVRVLLASGPAGIGKTRLAEYAVDRAVRAGGRAAWGRAWEDEGALPYWIWRQVLRELDRDLPEQPQSSDPSARFAFLDGIVRIVRETTAVSPIVVVLDDLHWADHGSLLALKLLARSVRASRLLVIGTYRDVEARLSTEAMRHLSDIEREATGLSLPGLSVSETTELARRVVGHDVDAGRLHDATQGNPFFVLELLRVVDPLGFDGARPLPLSDGVRALLRQRIDLLSPLARRALIVLSVLGREAPIDWIAELLGVDVLSLRASLGTPTLAHVVAVRSDAVAFAHDLVREYLYDDTPLPERAALHERIAELIVSRKGERTREHAASVAHHLFAAAPERADERFIEAAKRAGHHALARGAPETAVDHFEQALAALKRRGADRDVAELAIRIADAWTDAVRSDRARESSERALAAARELEDGRLFARAALSATRPPLIGRAAVQAVQLLEEALARLGDQDLALRVQVAARRASATPLTGDPAARLAMARDAIRDARDLGPDILLATLDFARGAFRMLDPIEERTALLMELRDLADARGAVACALEARFGLAQYAAERGDRAAVEQLVAEHAELARAHPAPANVLATALLESMIPTVSGDFDEGLRIVADALPVGTFWGEGWNVVAAHRITTYLARARRSDFADAVRLAQQGPQPAILLATFHAMHGDPSAARAALAGARTPLFAPEIPLIMLIVLAELVVALDDRALAEEGLPVLAAIGSRHAVSAPIAFWHGSMQRLVGGVALVAGELDQAIERLEVAVVDNQRIGSRPWTARSQAALAKALEKRAHPGDGARALELRTRAVATFEALGMDAMVDAAVTPASRGASLELRFDDDRWAVTLGAASVRVPDAAGLHYLAHLVSRAGEDVHVLDLLAVRGGKAVDTGDAGPLLDREAKAAYRRRLEELRETIREAEEWNDVARGERAKSELAALEEELARAVGLGGRDRKAAAATERARASVTLRIRKAIEKISALSAPLGHHLDACVKTGIYCRYRPPPSAGVTT